MSFTVGSSRGARSLGGLLAIALSFPVLLGARGCESETVPIGTDECDAAACGTALGLPTIMCADGSTAGNTGRCIGSGDPTACHWEVLECPPVECTMEECGTIPPTVPGSSLSCERTSDGTCAWVVGEDPTCSDPLACGPAPAMPSWICADGTTGGFTGNCILSADGSCSWEFIDCEHGTECTFEECGDVMPGGPSTICADGTIGGVTGRCLRDPTTGMCSWEHRTCPDPTACAGLAGLSCAPGEACIFGVGTCNTPDIDGVCIVPPTICTDEWAPVCGCDGHTYSNTCHAHGNGVSILYAGECEGGSTVCGGFAGLTCAAGEYCNYPSSAACGIADGSGECAPIPMVCPDHVAPVCGCDGNTYGNDCEAGAAGVSVARDGACDPSTL